MFRFEQKSSPAVPPAAAPAAGIASPEEAPSMPAASFSSGADDHAARRQAAIGAKQCRWIVAEAEAGAEALMCGAQAEPRRPFCAAHCARAFVKRTRDVEAVVDAEMAAIAAAENRNREDAE